MANARLTCERVRVMLSQLGVENGPNFYCAVADKFYLEIHLIFRIYAANFPRKYLRLKFKIAPRVPFYYQNYACSCPISFLQQFLVCIFIFFFLIYNVYVFSCVLSFAFSKINSGATSAAKSKVIIIKTCEIRRQLAASISARRR